MDRKKIILDYMPLEIRQAFADFDNHEFDKIEEIRMRINKPLAIKSKGIYGFSKVIVDASIINKTMELLSGYARYSIEDELKEGFITIEGGNRVGICGRAVVENGKTKTIVNINGLNIRIAHEVKGCADEAVKYMLTNTSVYHTMIISPPGCGKTTLLRDMVRILSDTYKKNIGVVDERGEIAGCYRGVPQNDIGMRTDVLDNCPKAQGMLMMIRSMSPQVIAVDEIGGDDDIYAVENVINSGAFLICTAHGQNINDIKMRPALESLINKKIFKRFIVLSSKNSPGHIEGVYDENFKRIN